MSDVFALRLASLDSQQAASLVAAYLTDFDGGSFELYGENNLYEIRADDLVAVTFLSMELKRDSRSGISTRAALGIERHRGQLSALLGGIPHTRSLHTLSAFEYDDLLGPTSAANRLYHLLRTGLHVHRVAAAKLLARKRPHLLPIVDSVVQAALGLRQNDNWWRAWWDTLALHPEAIGTLTEIRSVVGPSATHLSLLRVADIVVWMENHADREPQVTHPPAMD